MHIKEEIQIPADRVTLTRVLDGVAIFEAGGVDAFSEGITDVAYVFSGLEYIEVPTVMEFVNIREIEDPPERVPRDARVFEFYEIDIVSDGGMVVVSDRGIVGGRQVARPVGYVVAETFEMYRDVTLPSGNKWRQKARSK